MRHGTAIAGYDDIMGVLGKLKSLWWRFPEKQDNLPSETGRFLSKTNTPENSPIKEKTATTMAEKPAYTRQRRYPRYSLQGMDLHTHMVTIEEVDLQNISISGACIHTNRRLQPGRTFLLTIGNDKMSRSLRCKAVWIRASRGDDSTHKQFISGLQFQNISSDEIVSLKDFMRNFGAPFETRISDEFKPSPLRFSITPHIKAFLKSPKILNVRTISLCGMLMESDDAPEMGNHYFMGLPLPHEVKPIMIRGRIASILPRTKNGNPSFDVGVEFLSLEGPDRARLDTFIRSL